MESSLPAARLRPPPQTHQLLARPRLVEALEGSIATNKLTLIAAPAGSGKTTLLAQWARVSSSTIAWVSLTKEDNNPLRFLRCLLAAWETLQPNIAESTLGILLGALGSDLNTILPAFIDAASGLATPLVFAIDDYDLIDDPAIHEAVTFLLDHAPPVLHVVLSSRAVPPLPLARYRAHQELHEIPINALPFSRDETEALFSDVLGIDLPGDDIARLHAELEGWITGLQLVSLTLRQQRAAIERLDMSGRHRHIADYLCEEVLYRQPEKVRRFLLETSILDRLCGSLCDAVTGGESQEMLEILESERLFLMPLDDRREWYRYHRPFAGFLLGELARRSPELLTGLHRRAARWYLAHDLPEAAFTHAVAGDDLQLIIQIFRRFAYYKLHSGDFSTLQSWLDALPPAWYGVYPALGLPRAGLLAFTGQLKASLQWLDDIEQRLVPTESGEARVQLAQVTAIRCFLACMQNNLSLAETLAEQALKDLPDTDDYFRPGIYGALGDTYRQNGMWDEAKASYLRVLGLPIAPPPVFRIESVNLYGALADLELRQGHLRKAAGYWHEAMAAILDPLNRGSLPLPLTGWVFIRTAGLLYEWNRLDDAWDHLKRGLDRAELGGDVRSLIAGHLLACRLNLARGDPVTADDYLERARPLMERAPLPEWAGSFDRCQVELWLAQGKLESTVDWANAHLEDAARREHPDAGTTQLAIARVLVGSGDAQFRNRALQLLAHLLDSAESEGRIGINIEALALQALAHWRGGAHVEALTALEPALRLAEPEGYVRLFIDLGLPMARLVQEARSRNVMPAYVASLLAASSADLALPMSAVIALPEPLSLREQEVLRFLAAGLTNREIADRLSISAETVKKHTGSIYGKLGVGRRTEAVARARSLDLLE